MKFSIITPSFNQAKYITETIESIWSQSGSFEIEHIVMDGGSTDGTIEILKKYQTRLQNNNYHIQCKKIHFIWKSEKDGGQSDAINKGLKIASGDIFAYLNSDDTYEPSAFMTVSKYFLSNICHFVHGGYWIIDGNSKRIKINKSGKTNFQRLVNDGSPIGQPATFWSRDVYRKIGGVDPRLHYAMDYEYWCRISKHYNLTYINDVLACFREHKESKSISQSDKFWKEVRFSSRLHGGGIVNNLLLLHMYEIVSRYFFAHSPKFLFKYIRSMNQKFVQPFFYHS